MVLKDSLTSGSAMMAAISAPSLFTTGLGVVAGASRPAQPPTSTFFRPSSSKVGRSASWGTRLLPDTAKALSLPALIRLITAVGVAKATCAWPPMVLVNAGPLPVKGTIWIFVPATWLKVSLARCVWPTLSPTAKLS